MLGSLGFYAPGWDYRQGPVQARAILLSLMLTVYTSSAPYRPVLLKSWCQSSRPRALVLPSSSHGDSSRKSSSPLTPGPACAADGAAAERERGGGAARLPLLHVWRRRRAPGPGGELRGPRLHACTPATLSCPGTRRPAASKGAHTPWAPGGPARLPSMRGRSLTHGTRQEPVHALLRRCWRRSRASSTARSSTRWQPWPADGWPSPWASW